MLVPHDYFSGGKNNITTSVKLLSTLQRTAIKGPQYAYMPWTFIFHYILGAKRSPIFLCSLLPYCATDHLFYLLIPSKSLRAGRTCRIKRTMEEKAEAAVDALSSDEPANLKIGTNLWAVTQLPFVLDLSFQNQQGSHGSFQKLGKVNSCIRKETDYY